MGTLTKSVELTKKSNIIQRRLTNDIIRITQSNKVTISSDKTARYYKMDQTKYRELNIELKSSIAIK